MLPFKSKDEKERDRKEKELDRGLMEKLDRWTLNRLEELLKKVAMEAEKREERAFIKKAVSEMLSVDPGKQFCCGADKKNGIIWYLYDRPYIAICGKILVTLWVVCWVPDNGNDGLGVMVLSNEGKRNWLTSGGFRREMLESYEKHGCMNLTM